jgi:site-specific DNA-methyltransferase (adenine-specific)
MKQRNIEHKDNWSTPRDFYSILNEEFNFDFDPCPLNTGVIVPECDGLRIAWGKRNYMNPPYSRVLKEPFVKKAVEVSKNGALCVLLLPVSTSTKLFHDTILPNATEVRFVRGRISFEGVNTFGVMVGKGSAPMHDSMVVVFGKTEDARAENQGSRPNFVQQPQAKI